MSADDTLKVYRLATATRPALQVCRESALRAGRWHGIGDRVLYAYESEELAALSLSQLTQGVEPARLVHETLLLPADPRLHAEFHVAGDARARRAFFAPGGAQLPFVNLVERLREYGLLSLWVTSPYTSHQRTVLLNVDHPAFAQVQVRSHVLPGESFFTHGPCGAEVDDGWARTEVERIRAPRPTAALGARAA